MASIRVHRSKDGTTTFNVRYRIEGRESSTTFPTMDMAERFSDLIKTLGARGALDAIRQSAERRRGNNATVADMVERYIEDRTGINEDTRDEYRTILRKDIRPSIGKIPARELQRSDVERWVLAQEGTVSSKTIANRHGLLSAALNVAVDRGDMNANPAKSVKIARTSKTAEPVFLSRDEFGKVLDAIPDHYKTLVTFLAETGVRFGEAVALTPADVNIDNCTVRINKSFRRGQSGYRSGPTKTPQSIRTIKIRKDLLEMLCLTEPFVFTNTRGDQIRIGTFRTNVWYPAMKRTGLPAHRQPRIHDLRHTHASWLIAAGVPPLVIQKRLGHTDIRTTFGVYGHLGPEGDDPAVSAIERMFG
jgi:integrase